MSAQSRVMSRCDVAHCGGEDLHHFLAVLLRGMLPLFSIMTLWNYHGPASYPTINFRRKCKTTTNCPTAWPGVPASVIPTPFPVQCLEQRNHRLMLGQFSLMESTNDSSMVNRSTNFVCGVHTFVLRVHANLTFETYHLGIRTFVSTVTKNRITK